jgi:hypothetical protein
VTLSYADRSIAIDVLSSADEVQKQLSHLTGQEVAVQVEIFGGYDINKFTGDSTIDASSNIGIDGSGIGNVVWTIAFDKHAGRPYLLQTLPMCTSDTGNHTYFTSTSSYHVASSSGLATNYTYQTYSPIASQIHSNVMNPSEALARDDHTGTCCGHKVEVMRRLSGYTSLTGDVEVHVWNDQEDVSMNITAPLSSFASSLRSQLSPTYSDIVIEKFENAIGIDYGHGDHKVVSWLVDFGENQMVNTAVKSKLIVPSSQCALSSSSSKAAAGSFIEEAVCQFPFFSQSRGHMYSACVSSSSGIVVDGEWCSTNVQATNISIGRCGTCSTTTLQSPPLSDSSYYTAIAQHIVSVTSLSDKLHIIGNAGAVRQAIIQGSIVYLPLPSIS